MNITLPHKFKPREYQKPLFRALDGGKKRAVLIWHRRAGKDKSAFNYMICEMSKRVGIYYYFLPTYNQGRKIIWEGIDKDGFKTLDHIPKQLIKNMNNQEMKIELINGSLFRVVGSTEVDNIVGTNPIGCIFSEYALQDPKAWDFVRPILRENGGWALFVYTPRGNNHGKKLYDMAKKSNNWYTEVLTIDDTGVMNNEDVETEIKEGMDADLAEQEFRCFKPETDIMCQNEVKLIKDVNIGDYVLTHSNRYRRVKQTFKREYSGEMIKIKSYGHNKDLIVTPNHPIRVCNDGVNNKWIEAEMLRKGDRITFPRKLLGKQKYISKDLAKLIAWYIAEGSGNKQTVTFALGTKEKSYIKEIEMIAKKMDINCTKSVKENATQISLNSNELREFLEVNCGSLAKNKKIPFELISGYEREVYETLINGDGCRYKKGKTYKEVYSTISKTLAYQVQALAHMIGKTACFREDLCAGKGKILGRIVNISDRYQIDIYNYKRIDKRRTKMPRQRLQVHKYNVSTLIASIDRINYDGLVYNLQVKDDESYVANGRVTHNCSWSGVMSGSYYGKLMQMADKDKRITKVPYESELPVYTAWDLGMNDSTVIWFIQVLNGEVRLIDLYAATGESLNHYIKIIKEKPYVYAQHYAPHDIAVREMGTGKKRFEIAAGLGLFYTVVEKSSVMEGIDAVRRLIPRMWIDEDKCARGITAMFEYHKEYDEKTQQFKNHPYHDWTSDYMDALRTFAMGHYNTQFKEYAGVGQEQRKFRDIINYNQEESASNPLNPFEMN